MEREGRRSEIVKESKKEQRNSGQGERERDKRTEGDNNGEHSDNAVKKRERNAKLQ